MTDAGRRRRWTSSARVRSAACGRLAGLRVSRLRREHPRHDVLHHRHHGTAEGRLLLPSAARAAHAGGGGHLRRQSRTGTLPSRRRLHADHADVPRARLGFPVHRHDARREAGLSGSLCARTAGAAVHVEEKVTFSHCVPTLLHMLLTCPEAGAHVDMRGWKVVIGGSALSKGLAIAALERGIDVFAGYGMSETCPVLTLAHLPPDWQSQDVDENAICAARPAARSRWSSCRSSARMASACRIDGQSAGEIVARAPWLTQELLQEPERLGRTVVRRLSAHRRHRHD